MAEPKSVVSDVFAKGGERHTSCEGSKEVIGADGATDADSEHGESEELRDVGFAVD